MAANFDAIPEETKRLAQWCCWKLELVEEKLTKVPYRVNNYKASSTDPKTWTKFASVLSAYENLEEFGFNGICFMLSKECGIAFIDLDHCIKDGIITDPWVADLVKTLNTYTEISQSGEGLHILLKGIKPGARCSTSKFAHDIAIFDHARQCCLTGNVLDGFGTIESPQSEFDKLYLEIFGAEDEKGKEKTTAAPAHPSSEDDALIKRMLLSKNGDKIKLLWDGSWVGYKTQSEGDEALCYHLAFWCGKDSVQMDRIFRQSGLMRPKWDEGKNPSYGEHTIANAITGCKEVYDPHKAEKEEAAKKAALLKAQELLKDLPDKIKADVNIIKDPAILKALAIIKEMDRIDYDLKLGSVKKVNKALKPKSINVEVEKHGSKGVFEVSETKSPLEIVAERIPEWIKEHHFKTVADTERIYHYEHGVYLDDGEKILKALIEAEFSDITTDNVVRDVIGKVKRRTYVDRDAFNNQHLLNVENGLINLDTLELKPHTHEYLSTAQLGVTYDPEAKAPKTQKFLSEVAQSGNIALIEEIIGWLLWPDYHIHKAVMLLGPGRNGKGTLLRLITAFLGGLNVANVTLQDLVSDRFAKADLYGKLANIGGDLPSKDLSDTAAFRNLTGGDDVRAQEKYKPAFGFRNKAKMLFSANVLPRSPDDTYAFYSRWILIEFLNTFTVESGTDDPDLDAKLQTSEELSGLLNIALPGLKRLRENGWRFAYGKTVEDVEIMYKRNANPVFAFLLDECEPGEAIDYIEKTVFYNKFKAYTEFHGLRPLSVTKFGELLKDQTEIPVSTFRPWVEHGNRPMCWQGVKFQSIPSRVKLTPSLTGEKEKEKGIDEEKREGYSKVGLKQTIDGVLWDQG